MSVRWMLLLALCTGCTNPQMVQAALDRTEATLKKAHGVHARQCAPRLLASATSNLEFARLEFMQGDVSRAGEHLDSAERSALDALEASTPCGTDDEDNDTVPDIVDQCLGEAEDLDGDMDEDGCRDINPHDDEDKDGINNIDDACVDTPEDMDGDADEDGCPETSADRDGDTVIDITDRCPDLPEDLDGWEDEDGCPDLDNDMDGVNDILDQCPRVREDVDGYKDDDGCPDPDNDGDGLPDLTDDCPDEAGSRERQGCPNMDHDGDGVADANDRCPAEKENHNDYLDQDGCADIPPTRVSVTQQRIEPKERIVFGSGSDQITAGRAVLDDVYKVLTDAPDMKLRIEGHTDAEGSEANNLALSKRRAKAILNYLVRKGIGAGRLTADGFGETRPIDTNRTTSGRQKNRRVEFMVQAAGE